MLYNTRTGVKVGLEASEQILVISSGRLIDDPSYQIIKSAYSGIPNTECGASSIIRQSTAQSHDEEKE